MGLRRRTHQNRNRHQLKNLEESLFDSDCHAFLSHDSNHRQKSGKKVAYTAATRSYDESATMICIITDFEDGTCFYFRQSLVWNLGI